MEPTRALLDALGHPEGEYATVHVGGTNGKGSVSVLIYQALRRAGFSVGLYTSPHLVDVRERFIVDDRPMSREAFAGWTERLRPVIEGTEASFFEATTAMALADFAARRVDIAVVEVGLGGRLDSTNVIQPLACAVTGVAREHTEYLGESLEAIAREKAGIGKPGTPMVLGEPDPAIAALLGTVAAGRGAAPILQVPGDARYPGPLGLAGSYQRRNASVAQALLAALPQPWRPGSEALRQGFAAARLPGRFDCRGRWIFDVAHNPAGLAVLIGALREGRPPRPVHALVGILRDKAWIEMVSALGGEVDRVWLTTPPSAPPERRWDLAEVRRAVGRKGGADAPLAPYRPSGFPPVVQPHFDQALREVQQGAGTVLVTGSFHTVGDVMARLPGFAPLG